MGCTLLNNHSCIYSSASINTFLKSDLGGSSHTLDDLTVGILTTMQHGFNTKI
jgi:hypothetical protein